MNSGWDELLTIDEVAATLHVNRQSVRRWWYGKSLPAPLKLGRSVRWRRQTIEQWLADGCPAVADGGQDHE